MKYIKKISLALSLMAIALSSCKDDTDKLSMGMTVDKAEVLFAAEGGDDVIIISSSSEWVATSTEPWLKLSPANGVGTTDCELTVDASLIHEVRTGRIRITNEQGVSHTISVNQFGFDKTIIIDEPTVNIESYKSSSNRFFESTITTNVLFDINLSTDCDWITFDKDQLANLDFKHARPQSIKVRFNWNMNTEPELRKATIKLVPTDVNVSLSQ